MSATTTSRAQRTRGILIALVLAFAVLGMLDGLYLTIVHVDYELSPDSQLRKVCGALAANGCAVTTGRFGDVFGLPVSVIGFGGALATATAALGAWRRRAEAHDQWRDAVLGLATLSVLASMLMATFSFIEGSFCPFCVAWYGINLTMGGCAFAAWWKGERTSLGRLVIGAMGAPGRTAVVALVVGLSAGYLVYYQYFTATLMAQANATLDRILEGDEPRQIDLTGLPSRGPEDAPLVVLEVVDFQCPFCLELWNRVRRYTNKTDYETRVVVMHYPLDNSCNPGVSRLHPRACRAAFAAECARNYDMFFEYGDLLFDNQPRFSEDDLVSYAGQLGLPEDEFRACLRDDDTEQAVRQSSRRARKLGITTSPTFFVNGYKFRGTREGKWIRLVFDGLARRAEQSPRATG